MQPFSLSSISSAQSLSLISNNHLQTLRFKAPPQCYSSRICTPANQFTKKQVLPFGSSFLGFNPLRDRFDRKMVPMKKKIGFGATCYAASLNVRTLQWISTVSTAVLMLARGTSIHKSFLVPLLALQSPSSIVAWIKGEYGIWTAFLALIVRLFFFIPGELELPFMSLLLIIVAPYQVMNLRGTKEGVVLSLTIAAYLAFQHFSRAGSLQKAFDRGSIIATLAIICTLAVPCFFLF